MVYRYCTTCHAPVPPNHTHKRFTNGSTYAWRKQRALILQANPTCTHPGCTQAATEVHHVTNEILQAVCHKHNPRGG